VGKSGVGGADRSSTLLVVTDDDLVCAVGALADGVLGVPERAARIAVAIRDHGGHRWVGVYDVSTDPRYLTAFGTTRSEMIVPVLDADRHVVGTIDVEGDVVAAFGPDVRAVIERCAAVVGGLYRTR
jgi:hypothetical protein